jgi:hypothetical protein
MLSKAASWATSLSNCSRYSTSPCAACSSGDSASVARRSLRAFLYKASAAATGVVSLSGTVSVTPSPVSQSSAVMLSSPAGHLQITQVETLTHVP